MDRLECSPHLPTPFAPLLTWSQEHTRTVRFSDDDPAPPLSGVPKSTSTAAVALKQLSQLLMTARAHVRAFGQARTGLTGYEGCERTLRLAPPGDPLVGRAFQGDVPTRNHVVLSLSFERRDAWVSTDRQERPPHQRLPVADRYELLFRVEDPSSTGEPLELVAVATRTQRKLVPDMASAAAKTALEHHPRFILRQNELQQLLKKTSVEHSLPISNYVGIRARLHRLLGREAEVIQSGPKRSLFLRYYLDQWLPPGEYSIQQLYPLARRLDHDTLTLSSDAIAFTVEMQRGITVRHIPELFRGVMAHAVVMASEIVWWEDYTL